MPPNDAADTPALCVAIHDLAPATWPECLRLLRAIRAVADIPVTWLAVPRWHGSGARSRACETMLTRLLGDGHEIALHGYTHLDSAAARCGWRSRFWRNVYTEGEGEFAAIDAADARRRIDLGLAWCRERGWPVSGFVAPAWLLGEQAWQAVRSYPFIYTTTWSRFHLLTPPDGCAREPLPPALLSPALVYAARNRTGRIVSPHAAGALALLLARAPLVRLALHPRDAHHPALIRHAQGLLERLLGSRVALTKSAFARRLAGMAASTDQPPSDRCGRAHPTLP